MTDNMHVQVKFKHSIRDILQAIVDAGGRPFFVGGAVRDTLFNMFHRTNIPVKDFDVEVFGLSFNDVIAVLSKFGSVSLVGADFAVIKLGFRDVTGKWHEMDFSLPRIDNKRAGVNAHTDFDIVTNVNMSQKEACARRDFTINSIQIDPFTAEVFDFFGGVQDIKDRILRPTSVEHFAEDALRWLRGAQLAGRLNLRAADGFMKVWFACWNGFDALARERVWEEWHKWAVKSIKPSAGLRFMFETGMLQKFPEINALLTCQQDPFWHPEGNVFNHTCQVVDEMHEIIVREGITDEQLILELMFGALCHDFGKPATTIEEDGRVKSPRHDLEGEAPTRSFMAMSIPPDQKTPSDLVENVVKFVLFHMRHIGFKGNETQVRNLAAQVIMQQLAWVVEADHGGRFPLPKGLPAEMQHMLDVAETLKIKDAKPKKLLVGQEAWDILGMKQSPAIGVMQRAAWEAQMNGEFDTFEGAVQWAQANKETVLASMSKQPVKAK